MDGDRGAEFLQLHFANHDRLGHHNPLYSLRWCRHRLVEQAGQGCGLTEPYDRCELFTLWLLYALVLPPWRLEPSAGP